MNSLAHCRSDESNQFSSPFGGAFRWVACGLHGIKRAMEGRRMLRQLALADDRMLRDMGLTRSDLRSAAAEPLFRDPTELLAGRVDEFRMRHHSRVVAEAEGREVGTTRRPFRYY